MTTIDPDELPDEDLSEVAESRDRDGVGALRDVEEEAGDELAVHDAYDMDDREARELGVELDARDEPEPDLN